jgi:hypothetical protein
LYRNFLFQDKRLNIKSTGADTPRPFGHLLSRIYTFALRGTPLERGDDELFSYNAAARYLFAAGVLR